MDKLNKKGFTLIELLAVIVIMGIVLVLTVPNIIQSINNARLSSLHSLAKSVARWYDTSVIQDMLALNQENSILHGAYIIDYDGEGEGNTDWICIDDVVSTDGSGRTLDQLYGLSRDDILINGYEGTSFDGIMNEEGKINRSPRTNVYCSSVRLVDGRAEVFLVAARGGKFDTNADEWAYAFSSGTNGFDEIY